MKTEKIEIRVTPDEKAVIKVAAAHIDVNVSRLLKIAFYDWIWANYSIEEAKEMTKNFIK